MLLGIVLHGLLSFVPIPIWPAQDIHQYPRFFGFLQHAIHGFRMPLFFLLSGFFTAMLWQRRGLRGLLKQRLLRIGVPLVIGVVLVWPMMIAVGAWGGIKKREIRESGQGRPLPLVELVREGEPEALRRFLAEGERDLDTPDAIGITPLGWAAILGRVEVATLLLDAGASPNARNQDGSGPLHASAFFGRDAVAAVLMERGADPGARNQQGQTPLDSARIDWGVVAWLAEELGVEIDETEVKAGRRLVIERLGGAEVQPGGASPFAPDPGIMAKVFEGMVGVVAVGAFIPVFHHLWFLYYLLWLVAGFSVIAFLSRWVSWIRFPAATVLSRWRAAWFIPLVLLPQLLMTQTFGCDTATGIIPWPPKLAYYGVFFAIGALLFTKGGMRDRFGRRWWAWGGVAIPVLFFGLHAFHQRSEGGETWMAWHLATCVLAVVYAWCMIAAMVGLFRWCFPAERRSIRYLSDSAYFLYLAHLPLIMAAQVWVSDWDLPAWFKFGLVTGIPTLLLLGIYQIAVRYTFIGAILNGRKRRVPAGSEG